MLDWLLLLLLLKFSQMVKMSIVLWVLLMDYVPYFANYL